MYSQLPQVKSFTLYPLVTETLEISKFQICLSIIANHPSTRAKKNCRYGHQTSFLRSLFLKSNSSPGLFVRAQ